MTSKRIHPRPIIVLFLVLVGIIAFAGKLRVVSAGAKQIDRQETQVATEADVTILASGTDGIQFTLQAPQFSVDKKGVVSVPGLKGVWQESGAPALPYYTTLIALPPEADVSVSVQAQGVQQRPVAHVQPAPSASATLPETDNLSELVAEFESETSYTTGSIYEQDAFYPAQSYRVSEPMYYRDLRLVRLQLFPLRYNAQRQVLEHAEQMSVSISFSGAEWNDLRPAGGSAEQGHAAVAPMVLNYEQAREWRSLPSNMNATATQLPVGQETFKLEVNADGIYEVTYEDLQVAGMAVGSVDPNTFEMMYRGEPVAYELDHDGDTSFEPGEAVRFYGWAFDGSRHEKQYVENNVYWLWANGTPTLISSTPSTDGAPLAASFRDSVTEGTDKYYTWTNTDKWDTFPNEPDAWYRDKFSKRPNSGPRLINRPITITTPGSDGDALITVEMLNQPRPWTNDIDVYINGDSTIAGNHTWLGTQNVNITTTVPTASLNEGLNTVQIQINTENPGWVIYYLNRITVEYERRFEAWNDQLIFTDGNGPHTYSISGFTVGEQDKVRVWDITTNTSPQAITGVLVAGSGPFTYDFGTNQTNATIIATHTDNVLQPLAITEYVPPSLDPANGGTDWLAISHANFIESIHPLAGHRENSTYGGLDTHVVDVEDVINQYGYGLPAPGAIRDYLAHSLANWTTAPRYVLLVGDATADPKQHCQTDGEWVCPWGKTTEPSYVPTDLIFEDRYIGHMPSDYTFALLTDGDLLPDVAIGRIAAQTAADVDYVVEKIITYEELHLAPQTWQKNVLFIADNADSGGDFCSGNQVVGTHVPDSFNQIQLCIPADPPTTTNPDPVPSPEDVDATRQEISDAINPPTGVTFINYRGHGGVNVWADNLMSLETMGIWRNLDRPAVILSMDCLDGHFVYPTHTVYGPGLAESFLKLERVGSVAHWSSTGLGYDIEHLPLHYAFYDGVFVEGLTAIGDAINYAKLVYEEAGHHHSQLYSFVLQGDPAMQVMRQELSLTKSTPLSKVTRGETVTYTLQVSNTLLYPAPTTIVDTLPAGLNFLDVSADEAPTVTVDGNVVSIELATPLEWGESETIQLRAIVDENAPFGIMENVAVANSPAPDMYPSNNRGSASFLMSLGTELYMPTVRKH